MEIHSQILSTYIHINHDDTSESAKTSPWTNQNTDIESFCHCTFIQWNHCIQWHHWFCKTNTWILDRGTSLDHILYSTQQCKTPSRWVPDYKSCTFDVFFDSFIFHSNDIAPTWMLYQIMHELHSCNTENIFILESWKVPFIEGEGTFHTIKSWNYCHHSTLDQLLTAHEALQPTQMY